MKHVFFIVVFFVGINLNAQDSVKLKTWEISGYQKFLSILQHFPDLKNNYNLNFLHNRIQNRFHFGKEWQLQLDLRTRIFYGELVKLTPGFNESTKDNSSFLHLSSNWIEGDGFLANTMIDRMNLSWQNEKWYASIGRQRVNWGIHNIWNPNDLFNTYNLLDFDYEERPGADVLLLKYYSGINQSIEFAYQPDQKISEAIGAFMYRTNWQEYDLQIIAGQYKKDAVLGAAWAGALGNTGFKGEGSVFIPGIITKEKGKTDFNLSLMSDYTFGSGYYTSTGILYQSNEADNAAGSLYFGQLSPKQLFPYRWTVYSSLAKTFDERYSTSLGFLYAPTNKAFIVLPSAGMQLANNLEADLTGQFFWLKDGDSLQALLHSFYLRIRYSY